MLLPLLPTKLSPSSPVEVILTPELKNRPLLEAPLKLVVESTNVFVANALFSK